MIQVGSVYGALERSTLARVIYAYEIDAIFDVGANIGNWASFLRSKLGYRGWIFSFEPDVYTYQECFNLAANDPKWLVFNFGLGAKDGQLSFNRMPSNQFNSFLKPDGDNSLKNYLDNDPIDVVSAEIRRSEAVFQDLISMSQAVRPLLKLDTQGYDLECLKGLGVSLSKFFAIQTEISFKRIYIGQPTFVEVITYLQDREFEVCEIYPNDEGDFPLRLESNAMFTNSTKVPILSIEGLAFDKCVTYTNFKSLIMRKLNLWGLFRMKRILKYLWIQIYS